MYIIILSTEKEVYFSIFIDIVKLLPKGVNKRINSLNYKLRYLRKGIYSYEHYNTNLWQKLWLFLSITNIENTLKIFSVNILSSIITYVNRSLRYTNSKISLPDLISIPSIVVIDSIIKTVILIFKKLDEDYFNSAHRKVLYYPKGTYCRTIITLFEDITFKKRAYVDKNDKIHFYYLDSRLNISTHVVFYNDVINALLLLV